MQGPDLRLRVLLIEDDPGDRDLVCEYLSQQGARAHQVECVPRLAEARARLAAGGIDAVLLDLGLPDANGVACVVELHAGAPAVPIVVLTGRDNEAMAIECLAAGAQDYLTKGELRPGPLARAIAYAVARAAEAAERARADELQSRLAAIVEASSDAIFSLSADGNVTSWNRGAALMFGYAVDEAVGRPFTQLIGPLHGPGDPSALDWTDAGRSEGAVNEVTAHRRDGSTMTLDVRTHRLVEARAPGSIAVVCRDMTAERRQAEELRATNAHLRKGKSQLRQLAARLNAVREHERTRIAREVHDELGQLLTGIAMDLRWIERRLDAHALPDPLTLLPKLREAIQLAERTVASVQRIAIELRPSALDALGLVPAVRGEARRFEARYGVASLVEVGRAFDPPAGDVSTAFFRILQELLTNVARHAHAQRVLITLTASPHHWQMSVQDDGIGIDAEVARRSESLGLLGMGERAIAIGGRFVIAPAADGGTVATLEVPRGGEDA